MAVAIVIFVLAFAIVAWIAPLDAADDARISRRPAPDAGRGTG